MPEGTKFQKMAKDWLNMFLDQRLFVGASNAIPERRQPTCTRKLEAGNASTFAWSSRNAPARLVAAASAR